MLKANLGALMHRFRFFCNLAALGAAVVLIVAAAGFEPSALEGIGVGLGTTGLVVSLANLGLMVHERPLLGGPELRILGHVLGVLRVLAAAIAAVAVWEIVAAAVFDASASRWLTLGNGIGMACLAFAAVTMHERCTERIVHVLEIVERPRRDAY